MCLKTVNLIRKFSSKASVSYFTTPIYYVNAKPHIGHLYSSLIADAAQRWQQIYHKGAKIKFSTGTDEHGTKIQQAAKSHNTSLSGYCEGISSQYRHLADQFTIQYTDFIRTSEEKHKKTVQQFWNCLATKGHIYKSTYQGWYCISDETFLSDSQLDKVVRNGVETLVSAESGHPVEWSEEQNYIFKLSSFKDDLVYWLTRNENAVQPKKFYKILLNLIHTDGALSDISVSRPSSRVHWGIPVPGDDTQTIYVWLDALVNYLTVAGYSQVPDTEFQQCWPPYVQVIGKDILKFHGVYWPAFLIAAGLEPFHTLLCHSHWTVDGEKMSKSKGNVIDPLERSQLYSTDGLRYFLLREGVSHSDGNYSDTKVIRILNSELADTLGNLLSRCCGKALNPSQTYPSINTEVLEKISSLEVTKKLLDNLNNLPDLCEQHYNEFNFYKATDAVIATLHSCNLFFETLKPWELKKRPESSEELSVVLHLAMESLRISGIILQPLIPNISHVLLNKLGVPREERYFENCREFSWTDSGFRGRSLGEDKNALFKRLVTEETKKVKISKV
ncbi:methionine--tRNA ligase, mitochondrial [Sitophilus oryzae]|uniref:Methionine--tRNA ligase, mitochondrial n=1 Tax=Sitophilus oryzae TaxID=7048 RepID=A0A6J2Y7G0_SITOR|nr:methionine--tRNA ligase, mitochondrial [Sitophilus oryzae]